MAVNQFQVDHIITAAADDDPEVKLQNLEREVDLIKTSIKRLLMDIRERMNELENPFTLTASGEGGVEAQKIADAQKSALEAREAALDARESEIDATKEKMEHEKKKEVPATTQEPVTAPVDEDTRVLDEQMLAAFKTQISKDQKNVPPSPTPSGDKLRLHKVYKLFKWTQQMVKRFGHARLEIVLESYRSTGYISVESCNEIREISRLMPENLGEEHEISPDDYIDELYAIKRILAPDDTSLDRDMIELIRERRQQEPLGMGKYGDERIELANVLLRGKKSSSKSKENDEEWMNLPDRI